MGVPWKQGQQGGPEGEGQLGGCQAPLVVGLGGALLQGSCTKQPLVSTAWLARQGQHGEAQQYSAEHSMTWHSTMQYSPEACGAHRMALQGLGGD